jgi:hypothetical protein
MDSFLTPRTLDICFMPELLPDELLYSFIGRMSTMNALGNTRERMQLFFGERNLIAIVDLPTRLEYFQKALGELSPWSSALQIINQATIYPYHRPFLTEYRHIAIENLLLRGSGKSLKTLLGRVANRFGAAPELRFCSACLMADIRRYGISYWHRSHQLPGVTACPVHKSSLVVYSKDYQNVHRQRIILAPGTWAAEFPIREPNPRQLAFASLSNELMWAGLPSLESANYQSVYRNAIFRFGLNKKRYVDYEGLALAVRAYYRDFEGFPHRDRLLSTQRNPLSWLRTLIERPNRSSHPICHLLLIGFLFNTIEELCQQLMHKSLQANDSITSCLRPHTSYLPPAPNEHLIRDVKLSCREVARLTNRSVTTIVNKRRALGLAISERPKNVRPDTTAKIVSMLDKGVAPREVAVDCNASLSTVYRLLAQTPNLEPDAAARRFELERDKRRQLWTELLSTNPSVGTTIARNKSASTYAWLYRNDTEWLQEKSSAFRVCRTSRGRVDWPQRDVELCAIVRAFVATVQRLANRPRISRTMMTRHIGDASVRANLPRLPNLKMTLDELEESKLSYQRERIYLAAGTLLATGQPVTNWRVQRMAGIRTWSKAHSDFVSLVLNQHYATIRL